MPEAESLGYLQSKRKILKIELCTIKKNKDCLIIIIVIIVIIIGHYYTL